MLQRARTLAGEACRTEPEQPDWDGDVQAGVDTMLVCGMGATVRVESRGGGDNPGCQ